MQDRVNAHDSSETWITRGTPAYHRMSLALFLAGFATFSLLYCVQPLLPFFTSAFSVSAAESSLSVSLTTGFLALSIIVTGAVSEGFNRTRIIFVSMIAAALCNLSVALVPGWYLLLSARAAEGIVLGGVPAVAMAYLAEEVHPRYLGFAMGVYVSGTAFGGMMGRVGTAILLDMVSWRSALAIMAALGFLAALGFVSLLPAARRTGLRTSLPLRTHLQVWLAHLRNKRILLLLLIAFTGMGAFVSVYNYATYRLVAPPFSLSQTAIGAIFLAYLFGIIASSTAGALADRVGRSPILFLSIAVTFCGLALTLSGRLYVIVIGISVFTFGFFALHAVASGWVGRIAVGYKGHAASLYLLAYYAGSSFMGSLGGVFWQRSGWWGVAEFAALLLAVSSVAVTGLWTAEKQPAI